jgi:hypothetical protein
MVVRIIRTAIAAYDNTFLALIDTLNMRPNVVFPVTYRITIGQTYLNLMPIRNAGDSGLVNNRKLPGRKAAEVCHEENLAEALVVSGTLLVVKISD